MKQYLANFTKLAQKAFKKVRKARAVTAGYGSGVYGSVKSRMMSETASPYTHLDIPPSSPARRRAEKAKPAVKKQHKPRAGRKRKQLEQSIEREEWV